MGLAASLERSFIELHEVVYERTGGALGHRMVGVPSLLLYTRGRRTGVRRVNALVYAQRGADYLLVASNGGRDSPPGWLFNLRAEPSVELQVARKRVAGKASVLEATDAGYAGLWNLVNENNHNRYRTYQQRTSRPIPIVVVHPDRAGDVAD